MNLHQCLQIALNDCNLGSELSESGWLPDEEVIQHIKLVLSYKANDDAYKLWVQSMSGGFKATLTGRG